jgi:AmmeMemoRadiSam system protein A
MLSLSEADRQAVLGLARRAVLEVILRGSLPEKIPVEGVFAERRGVFVTLHVRGRLRGCIGLTSSDQPLGDSVVRCAVSAALQDPRFPPVRADDIAHLQIEISLLSPAAPIRPDQIEIGRHGLMISRGPQRGLLLPQVAIEHGLSVEQFLRETCRKALLPLDAWRDGDVELQGFTCEVFAEQASAAGA